MALKFRSCKLLTLAVVIGAVSTAGCITQETGSEQTVSSAEEASSMSSMPAGEHDGQELFGQYQQPEPWPQPLPDTDHAHTDWTWSSQAAVYAESPDRIWIAMRGELPLPPGNLPFTPYALIEPFRGNASPNDDNGTRGYERRYLHVMFAVNADGELVEYWPQHDQLFDVRGGRGPHKIKISPYDPEKHIWVIDDNLHQIHKFSYDGELILTHGEQSVPGRGPNNFNRPTDIAWLPDGTYFISDGYVGTRVAKYDADDNFIMDWGQEPADPDNPGPNEFDTVHAITISADGLLYVSDRAHGRIQVFDADGNFQFMFSTGPRGESLPYAIEVMTDPSGEEFLWIADGGTGRMLKYDLQGNYRYGWGTPGNEYGHFNGPHSITTDQDGNLYVAEVFAGRIQKFVPRPGADHRKLVGQQLRNWN
jgi:sugar lactone lactonase YvrE